MSNQKPDVNAATGSSDERAICRFCSVREGEVHDPQCIPRLLAHYRDERWQTAQRTMDDVEGRKGGALSATGPSIEAWVDALIEITRGCDCIPDINKPPIEAQIQAARTNLLNAIRGTAVSEASGQSYDYYLQLATDLENAGTYIASHTREAWECCGECEARVKRYASACDLAAQHLRKVPALQAGEPEPFAASEEGRNVLGAIRQGRVVTLEDAWAMFDSELTQMYYSHRGEPAAEMLLRLSDKVKERFSKAGRLSGGSAQP